MSKKIKNMFMVWKREDIYRYLRREQIEAIEDAAATIVQGRKDEGKPINEYIVCNQEERYADKIWQMILQGENEKEESGNTNTTSHGHTAAQDELGAYRIESMTMPEAQDGKVKN